MPRYFFDTDDGERQVRDEEGLELADDQAACKMAGRALAELALECTPGKAGRRSLVMWVRNEDGDMLWRLAIDLEAKQLL